MIDPELLHILCCPLSGQPVHEASPEELKAFGFKLDSLEGTGDCKSSDNSSVAWASCPCVEIQQDMGRMPMPRYAFDKPTIGLIREDGRVAYPVKAGIPILLPTSAISLTQEPSPQ